MNARGFVLLEWLVAAVLVTAVAGAVFGAIIPARDTITRLQHRVDMVSGVRGGLELLAGDLREAASPAVVNGNDSYARVLGTGVTIAESLVELVPVNAGHAVIVMRTPLNGAQARFSAPVSAGDTMLPLNTALRCATGQPACGFEVGHRAVIFDDNASEIITIQSVLSGGVVTARPTSRGYSGDTVLARVVTTTYGLRPDGGDERLVRLSDGGAEQPLVDHVVRFDVSTTPVDALRSPRVRVALRVQTPARHLRGPAGALFVRAGTATNPRQWLPDVELRADVALRSRSPMP